MKKLVVILFLLFDCGISYGIDWTVQVNSTAINKDAQNNIISKVVYFTVDNGAGLVNETFVSLSGNELLLTALEQKALAKQKIKDKILMIKELQMTNKRIETQRQDDTTLNSTYNETTP